MKPWVRIDTDFLRHPKVVGLSDRGKLAYLESILVAHEQNLDGHIVRGSVPAKGKLQDAIVAAGLWQERDGGIDVVGYLDRQESREERQQRHDVRAEAGRQGGLASGRARRSKTESKDEANASALASEANEANAKHQDLDRDQDKDGEQHKPSLPCRVGGSKPRPPEKNSTRDDKDLRPLGESMRAYVEGLRPREVA